MRIRYKPIHDPLFRETAYCLYRANNLPRATAWLDGLGLRAARTHWRAGVGYATLGEQHWEPAARQTGKPVVIVPAIDWFWSPLLVDLVALDPNDTSRWWSRTGEAICLGDDVAWPTDEPVRVHQTPWDWVRANGDGLCILDLPRMTPHLKAHPFTLIAQNINHGNVLDRALRETTSPTIVLEAA